MSPPACQPGLSKFLKSAQPQSSQSKGQPCHAMSHPAFLFAAFTCFAASMPMHSCKVPVSQSLPCQNPPYSLSLPACLSKKQGTPHAETHPGSKAKVPPPPPPFSGSSPQPEWILDMQGSGVGDVHSTVLSKAPKVYEGIQVGRNGRAQACHTLHVQWMLGGGGRRGKLWCRSESLPSALLPKCPRPFSCVLSSFENISLMRGIMPEKYLFSVHLSLTGS